MAWPTYRTTYIGAVSSKLGHCYSYLSLCEFDYFPDSPITFDMEQTYEATRISLKTIGFNWLDLEQICRIGNIECIVMQCLN